MSLLDKVENSPFIYIGFDPDRGDPSQGWGAMPAMCISDDGINWKTLAYFPQLGGMRDADIVKIDDYYWITGTLAVYRTKDFVNFESIKTPLADRFDVLENVWAPEFFQDIDLSWHIVLTANKTIQNKPNFDNALYGKRYVYIFDFNPETLEFTNNWQEVDIDCGDRIDSTIKRFKGKYYMFMSQNYAFASDNLLGPYKKLETTLEKNMWYEAPEILFTNDDIFLYQDFIGRNVGTIDGTIHMIYRKSIDGSLVNWTNPKLVNAQFTMRHGSFMYNAKKPNRNSYFPDIKVDTSFGTRIV